MLHLAVPSLPRDFGGVEDCLFRCSPIDNLITLCQVKSNCPKQWKSQESHLCHQISVQTLPVCPGIFTRIFLVSASALTVNLISAKCNLGFLLNHHFWITLWFFFPPYCFILTLQPFQSSQWIKCVESETRSLLAFAAAISFHIKRLNLRINKWKWTANI